MSVLLAPLDDQVLDRVILETGANPLALLELPRGLTPTQLAGGFGPPAAVPLHQGIEEGFSRRLAHLPADARRLTLIAAADPTGDAALVWRAAEAWRSRSPRRSLHSRRAWSRPRRGGVPPSPGALRDLSISRRLRAHRGPSGACRCDRPGNGSRPARMAPGTGYRHAPRHVAETQRLVGAGAGPGGLAAGGTFLERSAALTLDPSRRATRTLAAATARQQAGALDGALALLDGADAGSLDDHQQAEAELLRARILFATDRGRDAPAQAVAAAARFEAARHPARTRNLSRCAVGLGVRGPNGRALGRTSGRGPCPRRRHPPVPPRAVDLLLDGVAQLITRGPAVGTLDPAPGGGRVPVRPARRRRRVCAGCGCVPARRATSGTTLHSLTLQQIRAARDVGALGELPVHP